MADRTLIGKPSVPRLASRHLLQKFGVHPKDPDAVTLDMRGTRALCIATNHGVLDIGVATGVFGSELTVPYYVFLDAGMQVDVASPLGGVIPVDPLSMKPEIRTPEDDRLLGDAEFRRKLDELARDRRRRLHRLRHHLLRRWLGRGFRPRTVRAARPQGQRRLRRRPGDWRHLPRAARTAERPDAGGGADRQGTPADGGHRQADPRARRRHHAAPSGVGAARAGALFEGTHHPARDFFANHFVADGDLITGQNQNAGPMVARLMMQRVLVKRVAAERVAS